MLIGGITSASREAIRPIVDRTTTPYFYTNQYEGGVCDASMISIGAVPEQQFSTLIPWMIEKYGKKVYIIAADYNFGQISAEWKRKIVKELGGEMVGEEFIPLGVSQFAQTIQNIQKAKPDWMLTINVGAAQASFFEQAAAAKLNLPMGSSIKVRLGFEHKRFKPPALNNMYATANWFEEIDTPEANDFKKRWKAKFPNELYINDMGYNAYNAVYMYKTLVEKAKSIKLDDMRKVIATGEACIDAPEGQVCIDPKSQHTSHRMRLISVGRPASRSRSRRTTERSSRTGLARSAATSPRRMTRSSTRRAIFPRSRDTVMGTNLALALVLGRAHSRHDFESHGAATMRHREREAGDQNGG